MNTKPSLFLFIFSVFVLSACKVQDMAGSETARPTYELQLLHQQPALPFGPHLTPGTGRAVYQSASLEDALQWQEHLLENGVVTRLQRKGGPGND